MQLSSLEAERPGAAREAETFHDRLRAVLQECSLPDRQGGVHSRVFHKLLGELADRLDVAGRGALAAAIESEAARRQADDSDAPQAADASEPAPRAADKKGKAGKSACSDLRKK